MARGKNQEAIELEQREGVQIWMADVLHAAINCGASDVKVQTFDEDAHSMSIRMRVDGKMQDLPEFDFSQYMGAEVFHKVQQFQVAMGFRASMVPQDGTFALTDDKTGQTLLARVQSFMDFNGGITLQVRLPNFTPVKDLDEVDFWEPNRVLVRELMAKPGYVTIFAGPMGSGKTTTVQSVLKEYTKSGTMNIFTIEDPVERVIPGTTQISVRRELDVTMTSILPHAVRADYDVLLIGETRDSDTAEAAVNQGKVGRRVLTTLHANDGVSAIIRLSDDLIPHKSINSIMEAIGGIVSQRLIPRINPAYEEGSNEPKYKGRVMINEIMMVDDQLIDALMPNQPRSELTLAANNARRSTFEDNASYLLNENIIDITSLAEATVDVDMDLDEIYESTRKKVVSDMGPDIVEQIKQTKTYANLENQINTAVEGLDDVVENVVAIDSKKSDETLAPKVAPVAEIPKRKVSKPTVTEIYKEPSKPTTKTALSHTGMVRKPIRRQPGAVRRLK